MSSRCVCFECRQWHASLRVLPLVKILDWSFLLLNPAWWSKSPAWLDTFIVIVLRGSITIGGDFPHDKIYVSFIIYHKHTIDQVVVVPPFASIVVLPVSSNFRSQWCLEMRFFPALCLPKSGREIYEPIYEYDHFTSLEFQDFFLAF